MKNIILQHYTGELGELEKLSKANMEKYAEFCGAEYRLISGNLFRENLSPPCQKLYMLDPVFDEYDKVCMIDIDMFMRKGMTENIFDVKGIGMYASSQKKLKRQSYYKFSGLLDTDYAYWGGAIYNLTREQRIKLRQGIIDFEMITFNEEYQDEGIMFRLATVAKITQKESTLPGEYKWCHCSYRSGIEDAALIHIRTRVTEGQPIHRTKLENYYDLVERGLI
jgi:hypothetical protein